MMCDAGDDVIGIGHDQRLILMMSLVDFSLVVCPHQPIGENKCTAVTHAATENKSQKYIKIKGKIAVV